MNDQVHPIVKLQDQFTARQNQFQMALPPHMSADRFIRVVMTAVQLNPDLLACERTSLFNAAMKCAQDGLLPDGREAALVPFKSKCQYLPMYGGLLKKFRNSGQFKWVTAGIVYEGEQYEHFIDETGEHFKHVPGDHDGKGDRKIRRVYALATTKDGGSFIADMPLADINKRRNESRASREDAPWSKWPDEMMKKTAIRVLSKLLPMSSDIDELIRRDEAALLGVEAVEETRTALAERPTTQAMLDQFGGDKPNESLQSATAPSDQPDATDSETGTEAERSASLSSTPLTPTGEAAGAASHKPTAPAAEPRQPKTPDEYKLMAREKIANASDGDSIRAWFVSDQQRRLRNAAGITSEETMEIRRELEAKVKTLE
jgi:recombination protein RecT